MKRLVQVVLLVVAIAALAVSVAWAQGATPVPTPTPATTDPTTIGGVLIAILLSGGGMIWVAAKDRQKPPD